MGSVVAPIIGQQEAQNQINNANAARQSALQQYTGISTPSVADQQLQLQQYANAGNYDPTQEATIQQGPNALSGIQTDPRLLQAQMSALQQLGQVGSMGMTPGEKAALIQAQQQAAAQAQAKSSQVEDNFARRGMGGSGAELAAQLQNAQSGAQQAANNSNQVAQSAQQNALQAMAQSGQLGGQMQAQSFNQQAQVGAAQNAINQFNAMNSQNVANINTQNANQAQLRNLQNQQSLMNNNAQLSNQQQQYNKQLLQQQFNNQIGLAAGRAGQYQGIAQANQQQAGNTANMYAGIGQGVDTGVGAIYNASQKSSPGSTGTTESSFSPDEENAWLNSGSSSGYGSAGGGDVSELEDFA